MGPRAAVKRGGGAPGLVPTVLTRWEKPRDLTPNKPAKPASRWGWCHEAARSHYRRDSRAAAGAGAVLRHRAATATRLAFLDGDSGASEEDQGVVEPAPTPMVELSDAEVAEGFRTLARDPQAKRRFGLAKIKRLVEARP